eukprot:m.51272 g.51272  ORF g.51272 m.51272 type:complete len:221 (+) comp10723_c0_seq1:399-1061(+)
MICPAHLWVLIITTGRSGSTTLMAMLNTLQVASLTGENMPTFYNILNDIDNITKWDRNYPAGPFKKHVNKTELHDAMCLIVDSLTDKDAPIRGMKELCSRICDKLPIMKKIFPNLRIIHSYRENENHTSKFTNREYNARMRQQAETAFSKSNFSEKNGNLYKMPLENFDPEGFNRLRTWLGVEGCKFVGMHHHNKHKSYIWQPKKASEIVQGNCKFIGKL